MAEIHPNLMKNITYPQRWTNSKKDNSQKSTPIQINSQLQDKDRENLESTKRKKQLRMYKEPQKING